MGLLVVLVNFVCAVWGQCLVGQARFARNNYVGFAVMEFWLDGVRQLVGLFDGSLVVCLCLGVCFYKMLAVSFQAYT